jgi:hypothetical protein
MDDALKIGEGTVSSFDEGLTAFREIIRFHERGRRAFTDFRSGVIEGEEGYKRRIWPTARLRLGIGDWANLEPGHGDILSRVIHAIEIPGSHGNNLLFWHGGRAGPSARAHKALIEAREKGGGEAQEAERILKALYLDERPDPEVFENLVGVLGRNYPLLGYLFFIKDLDRFLPISVGGLEKGLREVGIELKLSGLASWENYAGFLAAAEEVRQRLIHALNDPSVTLLDAHSFLWVLGSWERPDPNGGPNQAPRRGNAVSTAGSIERTAWRMRDSILNTVATSNGQQVVRTLKDKITDMAAEDLYQHLIELLRLQQGQCRLTGMPMLLDGEDGDDNFRASPDRIDSDLGYVRGNIQMVCRFANFWKGTMPNETFLDLIRKIRTHDSE